MLSTEGLLFLKPEEAERQLKHRMALIDSWSILKGSSVLEIGCGQGEMSFALSQHVGPEGLVIATDIAPPDYGNPATISEAQEDILREGSLKNLQFINNFDVLRDFSSLPIRFDYVVFSHCLWYFPNTETIENTLTFLKNRCQTLCIGEWDLTLHETSQLPHMLAVLSQVVSNIPYNIQTPLTSEQLLEVISAAGWSVARAKTLKTSRDLADGREWEVDIAKVHSQVPIFSHLLSESKLEDRKSLDTLSIVAR